MTALSTLVTYMYIHVQMYKIAYVLVSELWEENFEDTLRLRLYR